MLKEWYTVMEAADYLGVSRRTVYKLCEDGRLPAYMVSQRRRRFRKEDLDEVPRLLSDAEDRRDAISAAADPVLAKLWDNERDAAYDDL
jgi:excisionase family DNA binding protein